MLTFDKQRLPKMKRKSIIQMGLMLPALAIFSCKESAPTSYQIQAEDLESHIITLSSDEFMGRMPFTEGETKTVNYLADEFEKLGLEPGNGDSFFQEVPLVSMVSNPNPEMLIRSKGGEIILNGPTDFVIWTQRTDPEVSFKNAELVFAGFGIVAPEYGWDDYKNIDVKGKIAVVLVNDPGYGSEDKALFKGNSMTYYGRWTYKLEEAARQGALGTLIVHETGPAGYGFNVVQNNWNSPKLYLDRRGEDLYRPAFEGWITLPVAEKLFDAAGLALPELMAQAKKADFQPFATGLTASGAMAVSATYQSSKNVIAKITGSRRPNEYLVYTAHWDHLGIGKPDDKGDSIYNGALDNASGLAALFALGKAFKSGPAPERTVLFLAVTAEEQGLWGSAYYAQNPIYPKEQTIANINIDGVNPFGKMRDVSLIGIGQSDLEDVLNEELAKVGRYSAPDPTPSAGYYYRSDHFNFAKIGIPALYLGTGIDHVEKGKEYGKQMQDAYTAEKYHKPSDHYDPELWDLEGGVEDVMLLFEVGKRLVNSTAWPQWKSDSEFKSIRDSYLQNKK
jgi:Zn-dependent M28 family amino/carboxypeptidase